MFSFLFDFFFPHRSLSGSLGRVVTAEELLALQREPLRIEAQQLRSRGVHFIDRLVASSTYQASPLLRLAVHRLKYRHVRSLSIHLGDLLAEAAALLPESPPPVLCPVPLHWIRSFSRGFNQSDLLARRVSELLHWPVLHLLRRHRATGHQMKRTREERLHAVRRAFSIRPNLSIPERIVLIDDVATTGATLDACAEALKSGGVKIVEALVVAQD